MSSIYSLKPAAAGVTLEQVSDPSANGLAAGYSAFVPVPVRAQNVLFAYDKATEKTDAYLLTDAAPWVKLANVKVNLSYPLPATKTPPRWDSLSTFVLGNESYIMAYEKTHGTFGFFHVAADLTVSKPYLFSLIRNAPTQGFTSVAIYTSVGQMFFTGYNFDDGTVANFSLIMTSTAADGVPPLLALNVWYHKWAKGWTHFAFFQMGGSNFFFKINTDKLNVNIDHMQDNPAMGSVEVGSNLQDELPDALSITKAAHIPWADGEPYLLTYIASSGATVVYRIHADCQGWTELNASTLEKGVLQVTPYRIRDSKYALFY
jgi:hypothetical protein